MHRDPEPGDLLLTYAPVALFDDSSVSYAEAGLHTVLLYLGFDLYVGLPKLLFRGRPMCASEYAVHTWMRNVKDEW